MLKDILRALRPCIKHDRVNCPAVECNPSGTTADQIIAQVSKQTADLKKVKQDKRPEKPQ